MKNLLNNLDEFLLSKTKREIYAIIGVIFMVTCVCFYFSITEISKQILIDKELELLNLRTKINQENLNIKNLSLEISKLKNDLDSRQLNLEKLKSTNSQIANSISFLSSQLQKNSQSAFLDLVSRQAKQNKVKLINISNNPNKSSNVISDIEFICNAQYGDLISFLNSIETLSGVVEIYNLELNSTQSAINAKFSVRTYGVEQ